MNWIFYLDYGLGIPFCLISPITFIIFVFCVKGWYRPIEKHYIDV